ncbi:MAG: N-acetylglucosamine-6-phosphate deacetylase [Gaiella sp.]
MRLGVSAAVVDGSLVRGDVEIVDGAIAAVGPAGSGRGLAIPGLVDLQVNGYAGVDVLRAEPGELVEMGRAVARDGVLAYQPTVVTAPLEVMRDALAAIGQAAQIPGGATILGAHVEGPFLASSRAGAHPVDALRRPSTDLLASLLVAGCPVTMLTIAPELDDADEVIEAAVSKGVVVSLGHTDATALQAAAGFDLGARAVTHLYNAMRPFGHRDPGTVGAALARDDVTVMAIADGVHVAPEAVLAAWRAARGRFVLVSDAIAAAGRGDGTFSLGAVEIVVADGVARTVEGALAGAVRPLAWGLRTLVELGVPIPEAVAAVTATPAALVGRPELGRLRIGGPANVVVLDDAFAVERVLLAGAALDG